MAYKFRSIYRSATVTSLSDTGQPSNGNKVTQPVQEKTLPYPF
ncbi:hypothetical protein AAHN97_11670 [Chitinophaga niabensis]